jgi:outer membrane protein insertion porin family
VDNNVNKMRLPPVWVALLAASATLSVSNSVSGQTVTSAYPGSSDGGSWTNIEPANAESNSTFVPVNTPDETALAGPETPSATMINSSIPAWMAVAAEGKPSARRDGPVFQSIDELTNSLDHLDLTSVHPISTETIGSLNQVNSEPLMSASLSTLWGLNSVAQIPPDTPSEDNQAPDPDETVDEDEPSNELEISPTPSTTETPAPPSPTPTPPTPVQEAGCPDPNAPQVLVAEVVVQGADSELEDTVYEAIETRPGRSTDRCQLQEDVNAIYATGLFSQVDYQPEDTPLGVRVTFVVSSNPVLRNVNVVVVPEGTGERALPQSVVDEIFSPQYGSTLNLRTFQEGVKKLNQWYKDNGYILAQIVGASQVDANGTVTLQVAEGVIEDIEIRFLDKDGEETDEEGNPVTGRTRKFIITREMALAPGDVLKEDTLISDLRRVFGLGLFERVEPSLNPGADPRKVVLVVNVTERNTGSVAAGAGISSATGLFGTISYQEQNLGGNNQKLGAQLQVGERALLFDVSFTDPWIAGDPFRTSYTVNGFRRRSISLIFDGGDDEVELPNGDVPRILRTGGGVTFTRPLNRNPLERSEWTASLGLQYQRISIRDRDGDLSPEDELGNDLSFSGEGKDDLTTLQFGLVRDLRNDPLKPTTGSLLRLTTEQSIPVGTGSIFMNRLRASYSYYVPVEYFKFAEGPQALAFNVQAGTVLGDLPPYEAFAIGGSNSVRGYREGDVGSGRSFVMATAEYRFPIFSILGGALFVDFGSDLGTGSSVPGDPAGIRDKPGTGFGYGLGVRVNSPLGPIRVDYGISIDGDSRFHFGLGERF